METQIHTVETNQNIILSPKEFDLLERIIHLEQRTLALEESMDKRFEAMQQNIDKRFEEMQRNSDKRFESMQHNMDKRFSFMQWTMMFGFTLLGVMITVYRFIPPITP